MASKPKAPQADAVKAPVVDKPRGTQMTVTSPHKKVPVVDQDLTVTNPSGITRVDH